LTIRSYLVRDVHVDADFGVGETHDDRSVSLFGGVNEVADHLLERSPCLDGSVPVLLRIGAKEHCAEECRVMKGIIGIFR
jgi:hypothetical protein